MIFLTSILCLCLLFIVSAIGKINNFSGTVKSLKSVFWIKKLPIWFYQLAILGVIVLLICAPTTLVYATFNPKYNLHAKYSCYALVTFTILATLLFHFPTDPSQRINLALSMHF